MFYRDALTKGRTIFSGEIHRIRAAQKRIDYNVKAARFAKVQHDRPTESWAWQPVRVWRRPCAEGAFQSRISSRISSGGPPAPARVRAESKWCPCPSTAPPG